MNAVSSMIWMNVLTVLNAGRGSALGVVLSVMTVTRAGINRLCGNITRGII